VDPRERMRLRYVVILFSDGFPQQRDEDGLTDQQKAENVKQAVRDLKKLQETYRLGDVTVNSAFLTGDPDLADPKIEAAKQLMLDVAVLGDGVYSRFDSTPGNPVTFRNFDFSSFIRSFTLKSLVAYNRNALPKIDGTLDMDSDGDGLTDTYELENGLEPLNADLDGDFVSDLVELTTGTDPLVVGDAVCEEDKREDEDGDGLRDCEEILLGRRSTCSTPIWTA